MQPRQLLRCHADCLVPRGQGKIEFGLNLVSGADIDRPTAISACATSGSLSACPRPWARAPPRMTQPAMASVPGDHGRVGIGRVPGRRPASGGPS